MSDLNGPAENRTLDEWRETYRRIKTASFRWDQVSLTPKHFLGLMEHYFELLERSYEDAVRLVFEYGKPSTSLLQRRLRISYGPAVGLLDRMQAEGLVAADRTSPTGLQLLAEPEWLRAEHATGEPAEGERAEK